MDLNIKLVINEDQAYLATATGERIQNVDIDAVDFEYNTYHGPQREVRVRFGFIPVEITAVNKLAEQGYVPLETTVLLSENTPTEKETVAE